MIPLKITTIKIGLKLFEDFDFDIISKYFILGKTANNVSTSFKLCSRRSDNPKGGASISFRVSRPRGSVYANMIISASKENVKNIEKEILSLLKHEIITYETMYKGKLGFDLDLGIFSTLISESLATKGVIATCNQNDPLEEIPDGKILYRPIYLKINPESFDKPIKWTPDLHLRCFEKPFHLEVKQLLLITSKVFWLPKVIVLNVIIPLLANLEQEKYFGKRGTSLHVLSRNKEIRNWAYKMTFHSHGSVSTNGIANYTMMNMVFYHVRKTFTPSTCLKMEKSLASGDDK